MVQWVLSSQLRRFIVAIALSLLSVLTLFSLANAQEQKTGILFDRDSLNSAEIISKKYTGACPGSKEGVVSGRFVSATTPPMPGARVVIRNMTMGLWGKVRPYTDREYDQGSSSEGFRVQYGTEHNGQYLAVRSDSNQFEYDIKQGDRILESGHFTAWIRLGREVVERPGIISHEQYCLINVPLEKCKKELIRTRAVRKCP